MGKISKLIYSTRHVTLSTDSWTCIRGYAYTAVNVHVVITDFKLATICAGLVRFDKSDYKKANAAALASQLRDILIDFPRNSLGRTCLDMASAITADGAAVMAATATALGKTYSHCLGHRIQLCIKEFVLKDDAICAFIGIASKIVSHVRRSTSASDTIGNRLQTFSRTRFNSYLIMVSSVLKNWTKIKEYAQTIRDKFLNSVCEFENFLPKAVIVCFLLEKIATLCTNLTSDKITLHLTLMEVNFFEYQIAQISTAHISQSNLFTGHLDHSEIELHLPHFRRHFLDCWRDRYVSLLLIFLLFFFTFSNFF